MRKDFVLIGIITLLLLFNISASSETIGYQPLTNKIYNINITLFWYSLSKSTYLKYVFGGSSPITFQYYLNINKKRSGYLLDYSNQTLVSGVTLATGCYFNKTSGYLYCLKILNESLCSFNKKLDLFICNVTVPNKTRYTDELLINPFLGLKVSSVSYTGSTYLIDFNKVLSGKVFDFNKIYVISGTLASKNNFIPTKEISITGELTFVNDTEPEFNTYLLSGKQYTIHGLYIFKLSDTVNISIKNVRWIVPDNYSVVSRYEILQKNGNIWMNVTNISFSVFNNFAVVSNIYPIFNFSKSIKAYILLKNASVLLNYGYMIIYGKLSFSDSSIKVSLPKNPKVYILDYATIPPKVLVISKPKLTCKANYCLFKIITPIFSSNNLIKLPLNISYNGELDPPLIYLNITNITYNLSYNLNTSTSNGLAVVKQKFNPGLDSIFLVPPLITDLFLFSPTEDLKETTQSGDFDLEFYLIKYADINKTNDNIYLSISFADPTVKISSISVVTSAGDDITNDCKTTIYHSTSKGITYYNITCKLNENTVKVGGNALFKISGTYSTKCLVTSVSVFGETPSGKMEIKDYRVFNPCGCKINVLGIYPDWEKSLICHSPLTYSTANPNQYYILACLTHNVSILIESTCLSLILRENATTTTSYKPYNVNMKKESTYEYNITVNFDTWRNFTETSNVMLVGIANPSSLPVKLQNLQINTSDAFYRFIAKYGTYKLFTVKQCNVTNATLYSLKSIVAKKTTTGYKISIPLNFTINKTKYCSNCCENCTHPGNITYNFTISYPATFTILSASIYNCPTTAKCFVTYQKIPNSKKYNITIYVNDTVFPEKKYNLTVVLNVQGSIDYPEINYSKKMNITVFDVNKVGKSFDIPVFIKNEPTYIIAPGQGVIIPFKLQSGWLNGNSNYYYVGIIFETIFSGDVGKVVVSFSPSSINNVYATTPYKSLTKTSSTITITDWKVTKLIIPEIVANLSGLSPGDTLTVSVEIYSSKGVLKDSETYKIPIYVPAGTVSINTTPSPIKMDINKIFKQFTVDERWNSGSSKLLVSCFFVNVSNLPPGKIGLLWGFKDIKVPLQGSYSELNNITRYEDIPFLGEVICFANISSISAINKTLVLYDPFNHTENNCFGLEFKKDTITIKNHGISINSNVYINLSLKNKKELNIKSVDILYGSSYCSVASVSSDYLNISCKEFPNISNGFYLQAKINAIENQNLPYSNFSYYILIPYLNFSDTLSNINWPNCGPGIILTYLGQCKYPYSNFYSTLGAVRILCRYWPWSTEKQFAIQLSNEKVLSKTYQNCYESAMTYFNGNIEGICSCIKNTTPLYNGILDVACSPSTCTSTCKSGSLCNSNSLDVMILPGKQCLKIEPNGIAQGNIEVCNLNNQTNIYLKRLRVNVSYYKSFNTYDISPNLLLKEGQCTNYTFTVKHTGYYPLFYKINITSTSLATSTNTNFIERDVYYLGPCQDSCKAIIKSNLNKITLCNTPSILELNVTLKCPRIESFNLYIGLIKYVKTGEIYIENITPYNCTTRSGKYCIFKFKVYTQNGKNTIGWILPVVYINKSVYINKVCLYNGLTIPGCKIPVLLGELVNITFESIKTGNQNWCYCPGEVSTVVLNVTNNYNSNINANISLFTTTSNLFNTNIFDELPSCSFKTETFENVIFKLGKSAPQKLLLTAIAKDRTNGKIIGENSTEVPICINCGKCFQLIWTNKTQENLICDHWSGPNNNGVYVYKYVTLQFNISRRNLASCPGFNPEFQLIDDIPGNQYAYDINISNCRLINHANTTTSYAKYYNLTLRCEVEKVGKIYVPSGSSIPNPTVVKVYLYPNKISKTQKFFIKTLVDYCSKEFNKTCYLNNPTVNGWLYDVLDIEQYFKNNKLVNNYVICAGDKAEPKNYSTNGCYAYDLKANGWAPIDKIVQSCTGGIAMLSYEYYKSIQTNYVKNIISKLGASSYLPWNQASWSELACEPGTSGCIENIVSGKEFLIVKSQSCCGSCSGKGICQFTSGKCICIPYISIGSCLKAAVIMYCIAEKDSCSVCSDLSNPSKARKLCNAYMEQLNNYPANERADIIATWIGDVLPTADEKCNIYAVDLSGNKFGPGWICKTSYLKGTPKKDRAYTDFGFKAGQCVPAAIQFGVNCHSFGMKPDTEPVTNNKLFKSICINNLSGISGLINDKVLALICNYKRTNCLSGENWTTAVRVSILGANVWSAFCAPSNPCANSSEYEQIYIIAYISGKIYWCRIKDSLQGLGEMGNNCSMVEKYCLKANISTRYCTFIKLLTPKKDIYINVIGNKVFIAGTVELSKNIQEAFGYILPGSTPQLRWILLKQISKTPVVPEVPIYIYPVYLIIILIGSLLIFRRNRED